MSSVSNLPRHPEQRNGEVFLSNLTQRDFEALGLKTKRKGYVAFYKDGEIVPEVLGYFPVFAQESEYAAACAEFNKSLIH